MIGVLGGMGPLATLDFFDKVIAATGAEGDEGHVPLLIQSDPRIPSRPAAILRGGESPLPALIASRDRLIAAGAVALAMPCNTAHYWYADLVQGCPVPFLSIVDACCDELVARAAQGMPDAAPGSKIGIIATKATLEAGIFDAPIGRLGCSVLNPDESQLNELILPGIEMVKAGRTQDGGRLCEQAVKSLLSAGASTVVLACTEVPVALAAVQSPVRTRCIDSTDALARSCVAWWREYLTS